MDPATTAALISAGSNILGGFLGNKGPGFQEQLNNARTAQHKSIMGHFSSTVDAAKQFGINKLAALGIAPAGSFNFQIPGGESGNPVRDALSNAGADVSRAVASGSTSFERLQERLLSSQIDGQELDNAYKASQIARTSAPHVPPPMPTVPRTVWAMDRDGRRVEVTNPDAGDNEFLMMHDYLTRTLPQDFKNMFSRSNDWAREKLSKRYSR